MDAFPLLTRGTRLWKDKADFFKPFRSAAKEHSTGSNIRPIFDPDIAHGIPDDDDDLTELNTALQTLVDVFPDIDAEVFRDVLSSISPESRVAVVAEQVLKRNLRQTSRRTSRRVVISEGNHTGRRGGPLLDEEKFRGERYYNAVKVLFYQEFRSLSHSTIKGVMAEHNSSYITSRPTLQYLSSKTWRTSFANLWNRGALEDATNHPAIGWHGNKGSQPLPFVKSTGSNQLDKELYDIFVKPIVEKRRQEQVISDQALADSLNEDEAIECSATYDCECCYSTVAFEQIATCDAGDHFLCFECIRRTTTEAIFGQGWARSADLEKSTIRCFAPALKECQACIPIDCVQRALQHDLTTPELWPEFNKRITNDILIKSRLKLQHCPSCDYAEVDEVPRAALKTLRQFQDHAEKHAKPHVPASIAVVITSIFAPILLYLLVIISSIALALSYITGLSLLARSVVRRSVTVQPLTVSGPLLRPVLSSLGRVHQQRRGLKFRCRHSRCKHVSCVRCSVEWRDPHVCFDNEKTSLRTAIEASATAAVKRTCPRCLLSFVKSSGCNKLVCNCGYTMCYVCRSEITSTEGYAHFCQHFRPMGGNCTECDRCDLYGDEDEATAIRRAEEMAEREWKEKEAAKSHGKADEQRADAVAMVESVVGIGRSLSWPERLLDSLIDAMVIFEDDNKVMSSS